jgi:hypothetical protein
MTTYQILYWHDIPLQVRAGPRSERISQELDPRFQAVVDQVAMISGLTGTDAYLDGFHWDDAGDRPGPPQEVVEAVVGELESSYERLDWQKLATTLKGRT